MLCFLKWDSKFVECDRTETCTFTYMYMSKYALDILNLSFQQGL